MHFILHLFFLRTGQRDSLIRRKLLASLRPCDDRRCRGPAFLCSPKKTSSAHLAGRSQSLFAWKVVVWTAEPHSAQPTDHTTHVLHLDPRERPSRFQFFSKKMKRNFLILDDDVEVCKYYVAPSLLVGSWLVPRSKAPLSLSLQAPKVKGFSRSSSRGAS